MLILILSAIEDHAANCCGEPLSEFRGVLTGNPTYEGDRPRGQP
jgi:hypothetical protein